MSKVEVNQVTQQCGTTLTVGGGACKTAVVDATTVTLGRCGGTVSLASGATQSGFGRTGTVDWITTPKVTGDSPVTGVSGKGYFMNTTAGTITLNLPAGSAGDIISLMDYAATWDTNSVTVAANGAEKIGGIAADAVLNTEGQSVTFVYANGTQGWLNTMDSTSNVRGNEYIVASGGTESTCGNCKVHKFTGPGTLTVSQVHPCAANNLVSYMVVAGGGAGGTGHYAGGAGAGGYRETKSPVTPYTASPLDGYPNAPNRITISATPYPITVGGGGTASTPDTTHGTNGSTSTFSSIDSAGGGAGGSRYCGGPPTTPVKDGVAGGSGGGGAEHAPAVPTSFGAGNTPPTTPAQGTNGGFAGYGAGGGGATVAASPAPATATDGSAGGNGATTSISFSPLVYAGGGGGGTDAPTGGQPGGTGGGGKSSCGTTLCAEAGSDNLGGGGGGGSGPPPGAKAVGGAGGSGIVIIRYKFQ